MRICLLVFEQCVVLVFYCNVGGPLPPFSTMVRMIAPIGRIAALATKKFEPEERGRAQNYLCDLLGESGPPAISCREAADSANLSFLQRA